MRKMLLVMTVFALAVVGADPAAAQDPCQPSCETLADDRPAGAAAAAPLFLAMAALWRPTRSSPDDRRT